jgi:hypothetical protein
MEKPEETKIVFRGIELKVDWIAGAGVSLKELPTCAGIYAEVHWPKRGVRIGETGKSIRGKISHDISWFKSMQNGTAPPNQLSRTIPIAMTAKESGANGFEFYVVSADLRLVDKELGQACERYMFQWIERQHAYVSWNHQKSWR